VRSLQHLVFVPDTLPDGQDESRRPLVDVVGGGVGGCCCRRRLYRRRRRGLVSVWLCDTYSRVVLALDVFGVRHGHLPLHPSSSVSLVCRLHFFPWLARVVVTSKLVCLLVGLVALQLR
jgi:hypothetical protein